MSVTQRFSPYFAALLALLFLPCAAIAQQHDTGEVLMLAWLVVLLAGCGYRGPVQLAKEDGKVTWHRLVEGRAAIFVVLTALSVFVGGIALRRFEERRASLHDVFLHMVGTEESAK